MRSVRTLVPRSATNRLLVAAGRALVAAAVVLATLVPQAATEDELEWSVLAPLAPRSLLLDVAAADGRLVAVGERGHVLISDDSGASWKQVVVPTRSTLTGVFFLDRERGWAVGHDAVILRTTDGGQTWERVHWAPEEESPLFDVWFSSPLKGFAVGAYGSFYVTHDGGESWVEEPISEGDAHLHKLAKSATGTLFLAAEAGTIFRSSDGGETWDELESPYEGSYFGVLPLEGDVVLVFGLRGHLYRSQDAGESWEEIETRTTAMLTDGVVLADGTVVVVGLAGAVLISGDGGRSFELEPQADRGGANAVVEGTQGSLVLVGDFGIKTLAVGQRTPAPGRPEGGESR